VCPLRNGPAVEQLSQIIEGKLKAAKLNIDENQEIAMKYGIVQFPHYSYLRMEKELR
jgi:thioredoxin 1